MENVKICQRCKAVLISNLDSENCDYYRHISVKYCAECKKIVTREKTNERVKRYNQRKKLNRKADETKLNILESENIMLYNNYIELCSTVERLKKEIDSMKADVGIIR